MRRKVKTAIVYLVNYGCITSISILREKMLKKLNSDLEKWIMTETDRFIIIKLPKFHEPVPKK